VPALARLQPAPEMDGLVLALLDPPGQAPALEGELFLPFQMDRSRVEGDIDRLPLDSGDVTY
jgi:hypothetical protein